MFNPPTKAREFCGSVGTASLSHVHFSGRSRCAGPSCLDSRRYGGMFRPSHVCRNTWKMDEDG